MKLKVFTLTPLDILDLTDEVFEHSSTHKHDGSWIKSKGWFAESTEYRSAKDQERVFITQQDDEIQGKKLHKGMILERGYNRRDSGRYGVRLRTWYLVHSIYEGKVYVSLHNTAKRAFLQKAGWVMSPEEFESAYCLQEEQNAAIPEVEIREETT